MSGMFTQAKKGTTPVRMKASRIMPTSVIDKKIGVLKMFGAAM